MGKYHICNEWNDSLQPEYMRKTDEVKEISYDIYFRCSGTGNNSPEELKTLMDILGTAWTIKRGIVRKQL